MAKKRISAGQVTPCIMEFGVTTVMYKLLKNHVKQTGQTFAEYMRGLVAKDLKVDEYGNPTK